MDLRFEIEHIYKEIGKCGTCCNQCPKGKLAACIEKYGIEEFCRMYENHELPEDVVCILEEQLHNTTLWWPESPISLIAVLGFLDFKNLLNFLIYIEPIWYATGLNIYREWEVYEYKENII